jgi:hypothetical protein
MIVEKADIIKSRLKDLLKGQRCSFTVDAWTSRAGKPFLGMSVHWIDEEMVMHTACIGMVLLEGSHTGGALAKAICEILVLYDISDPVSMTGDNAANQVRAFDILIGTATARHGEPAPDRTFPNLIRLFCVCHGAELVAGKIAAGAKETRRASRRGGVDETKEALEDAAEPNDDVNEGEFADAEPSGSGEGDVVQFGRGVQRTPARNQTEARRAVKEVDIAGTLKKAKNVATHMNKSAQTCEYLVKAQKLTAGEEETGTVKQVCRSIEGFPYLFSRSFYIKNCVRTRVCICMYVCVYINVHTCTCQHVCMRIMYIYIYVSLYALVPLHADN